MTPMTKLADAAVTFDVQKIREDFPILAETIHGRRLVYLDNANTTQKPRQVLDALDQVLPARQREHPPRDTPAERARDGSLRGHARRREAVHQRRRYARSRLHQGLHRGHQPGGIELGPLESPPGRRSAPDLDGAPLEHRSVAARVRADRGDAEGLPHHRSRRAGSRRLRSAADSEDEAGLDDPREQLARDHQPGRQPHRPCEGRRRRGPRGRCAGRRAHAGGRAGDRLRLLRVLGAQDSTGPRAPACSTDARRCSTRCRPTRAAAT